MKYLLVSLTAAGLLTLGGFAWLGGWAAQKPSAPSTSGASSVSSDFNSADEGDFRRTALELMQQVAILRAEVAELRKDRHSPLANVGSGAPVQDSDSRKDVPLDAKEIERQKDEWHGVMSEVEASFHDEARDPSWSAEVTTTVHRAFQADQSMSAQLRNLDCRSRTCRLELSDDEPSEPISDKLVPVLAQLASALPKMKSEQLVEANGKKTMVLYMSRRPEG